MNWTRDEREWSQQHRRSPVLRYSVVFYIILQLHKKNIKMEEKRKNWTRKIRVKRSTMSGSQSAGHPNPEWRGMWKKNNFCAMHHNCIKRMENGFGEILFSLLCEIFIFIECDGGRTKPPSLRGLFGVGENFVWWFDDDNLKVKNAKTFSSIWKASRYISTSPWWLEIISCRRAHNKLESRARTFPLRKFEKTNEITISNIKNRISSSWKKTNKKCLWRRSADGEKRECLVIIFCWYFISFTVRMSFSLLYSPLTLSTPLTPDEEV